MLMQIAEQRQGIDTRSREAIGRSLQAAIAAADAALAALEAGRDDEVRCLLTDAGQALKDARYRLDRCAPGAGAGGRPAMGHGSWYGREAC